MLCADLDLMRLWRMKKSKVVHYRSSRTGNVSKYKPFLDSCERLLKERGAMHKKDLICGATTKKGTKLRCGIPIHKAMYFALINDTEKRFKHLGDGVWDLANREVEV